MTIDPRVDPRAATSEEVEQARLLSGDTFRLKNYWNELFKRQYFQILESEEELGRHGIIAEIIIRCSRPGVVVDAGCGTGILSSLLPSHFGYIGIDISDSAVAFARKTRARENAEFFVRRIEECRADFRGAAAVVFNEILYYLNVAEILTIARSWIGEDGLLVASVFDFQDGQDALGSLVASIPSARVITVENPTQKLKWTVVSGRFGKAFPCVT